jgi:hypothetical protein
LNEEQIKHLKKLVAALSEWRLCMSYNDSYFGEPSGLVKRTTRELMHLIDSFESATQPAQDQVAAVRAVPEGWKIVPRKLTEEQSREIVYNINRKYKGNPMSDYLAREVWSWGIHAAAAPSPQPELSGSIDSDEFRQRLRGLRNYTLQESMDIELNEICEAIDAWKDAACAVAREEGYAKKVSHVECGALAMLEIEMKRATDAEAKLAALPKKVRVPNNGYSALTKRWAEGWNDCVDAINTVPPQSDTNGLPG